LFGGGNSIPTITNQKMCSVASVCAAAVRNQKQWKQSQGDSNPNSLD
jgi:hypothetical protein